MPLDRHGPRLVGLDLGEPEAAWSAAGFDVRDGCIATGGVVLRARGDGTGIRAWQVAVGDDHDTSLSIDDLPNTRVPALTDTLQPNGVIGLDHIVISTPHLSRTTAGFERVGIESRLTRRADFDLALAQRFFVLGTGVAEVVGPPTGGDLEAPATFWGLAFVVADMDLLRASLGDLVGEPRAAVQPGREIAVLRGESIGIGTRVAFLTPRVDKRGHRR